MDARPTELIQKYEDPIEVAAVLGVKETRNLYDKAIDEAVELKLYEQVMDYIVKRAKLETSLGNFKMARMCYQSGSDYSSPHGDAHFWNEWSLFEKEHGNHDTFQVIQCVKSFRETCNVYMERHLRCAACQKIP